MLAYIFFTPFKKNIRFLRRKHKISQKEMAKQMDMTLYSYVKTFEAHPETLAAVFDSDELFRLCENLFATPFELLELDLEELDRNQCDSDSANPPVDWDTFYKRIMADCVDPDLL